MSHIDDAPTRVTGDPAETPKPRVFRRFVADSKTGRRVALRGDDRPDPQVSAGARQAVEGRSASASTSSSKALEQGLPPTDWFLALRHVVHYTGFAARAVLRHKFLVVFSFLLTFSMIVVATMLAPRTYEIEVKLLAQRSHIMQSLTNPGRTVPYDADAPTRAAAETVLRRDNVISLIRQTDLLNEWERARAPILRLYDRGKAKIVGREPTLDEKLEALVTQIEKRMVVSTTASKDGVVSIYLAWPDAHSGYLFVERAQQAFLDARRVAETQAMTETIAVLEDRTKILLEEVQVTLGELSRTEARVLSALPARGPSNSQISSSIVARTLDGPDPLDMSVAVDETVVDPANLADSRLGRLKNAIGGKRGELVRLEQDQKRKLDDLRAQLSVARTIYTPNHPTVQSLQQSVAAFQHNSPQITFLRHELDGLETEADEHAALAAERLIRAEMSRRGMTPRTPPRLARVAPATAPSAPAEDSAPPGQPRPSVVVEFATLNLRTQLNQLRGNLERTDAARIEFEASKAAFKHRYSMVSPAEEPGDPLFPDTRRIVVAGFLASVLFALFAAIATDILSYRILEPWQVQRQLGLPVLGKVRLS